jgi:large subunit ribosomal protein L15
VKLHDLRPAEGSHRASTRVGRGIAGGKGKTAGRGTKGQKARAGGSIPAWVEGGQTPLHMRIPKLRGFKNAFKVKYEIVNLGDIARLAELGRFEPGDMPNAGTKSKTPAPITVNAEILRGVGLVRTVKKPLKVLGGGEGELSTALFVVADSFSRSAITKIEAAGGSVSVLEVPRKPRPAIGLKPRAADEDKGDAEPAEAALNAEATKATEAGRESASKGRPAKRARAADAGEPGPAAADAPTARAATPATSGRKGALRAGPDETPAATAGDPPASIVDAADEADSPSAER